MNKMHLSILYILTIFIINCNDWRDNSTKVQGTDVYNNKSSIRVENGSLFVDSYKIPILINYNKYKIDTLGWCDGGEIECLRFSFIDTTNESFYIIDYKRFKEDRFSPSGFIQESDVENLYLDSSYKIGIRKISVLNSPLKYLFTFYGLDLYISEFKYYNDKHYFKLKYHSAIKDTSETNLALIKLFNSDLKVN